MPDGTVFANLLDIENISEDSERIAFAEGRADFAEQQLRFVESCMYDKEDADEFEKSHGMLALQVLRAVPKNAGRLLDEIKAKTQARIERLEARLQEAKDEISQLMLGNKILRELGESYWENQRSAEEAVTSIREQVRLSAARLQEAAIVCRKEGDDPLYKLKLCGSILDSVVERLSTLSLSSKESAGQQELHKVRADTNSRFKCSTDLTTLQTSGERTFSEGSTVDRGSSAWDQCSTTDTVSRSGSFSCQSSVQANSIQNALSSLRSSKPLRLPQQDGSQMFPALRQVAPIDKLDTLLGGSFNPSGSSTCRGLEAASETHMTRPSISRGPITHGGTHLHSTIGGYRKYS